MRRGFAYNGAMSTQSLPTKPHYLSLDALRGVAAVMVVLFHIMETHMALGGGTSRDTLLNHTYLAVDFFFLLSGFVIGYAYDSRKDSLSVGAFLRRRLIRLQPMVVIGGLLGAALFWFHVAPAVGWGGIPDTPVWQWAVIALMGCLLLPVTTGWDIRGWNEMFPLNAVSWSLFYEYIGNLAYVLVIRRLPTRVLGALTGLLAFTMVGWLLFGPQGDVIRGWTFAPNHAAVASLRLFLPFCLGLLMSRTLRPCPLRVPFPALAAALVVLFSVPRLGGEQALWVNGLYEAFCLLIAFPLIVWLGSGCHTEGAVGSRVCTFLGDLSYPLYITHFPIIYSYTAFVANTGRHTLAQAWPFALLAVGVAVIFAWVTFRFIDLPLRRWLSR